MTGRRRLPVGMTMRSGRLARVVVVVGVADAKSAALNFTIVAVLLVEVDDQGGCAVRGCLCAVGWFAVVTGGVRHCARTALETRGCVKGADSISSLNRMRGLDEAVNYRMRHLLSDFHISLESLPLHQLLRHTTLMLNLCPLVYFNNLYLIHSYLSQSSHPP